MRYTHRITKVVGLAIGITAFVCVSCAQNADKLEKMPQNRMYATHPHSEIKRAVLDDELDREILGSFLNLLPRASNIFLAKARDVKSAAEAGVGFLGRDELILSNLRKGEHPWLVVFFGFAQSSPRQWTVQSVEYSTTAIRVTFAIAALKGQSRTADYSPYFLYVPFPDMRAGSYRLELRDSAKQEPTLVRNVRVGTPDP